MIQKVYRVYDRNNGKYIRPSGANRSVYESGGAVTQIINYLTDSGKYEPGRLVRHTFELERVA